MVLKRKFSANHYFEDVRKYNVTVIQYIGELCRYLLSVPKVILHMFRHFDICAQVCTTFYKETEERNYIFYILYYTHFVGRKRCTPEKVINNDL